MSYIRLVVTNGVDVLKIRKIQHRPLYRQVQDELLIRIGNGEWLEGEALPSEWSLADELSVSQGTVRKALDELVSERVLERRQGSGTYVLPPEDPSCTGRAMLGNGEVVNLSAELLSCTAVRAGEEAAWRLRVQKGEPLWSIRRLLKYGGIVCLAEELLVRASSVGDLDARQVRPLIGNLPLMYRRFAGLSLQVGATECRAVLAEREPARLLQVAEGMPVLLLNRVSMDQDGRAVEWSVAMGRTDQFSVRFRL